MFGFHADGNEEQSRYEAMYGNNIIKRARY